MVSMTRAGGIAPLPRMIERSGWAFSLPNGISAGSLPASGDTIAEFNARRNQHERIGAGETTQSQDGVRPMYELRGSIVLAAAAFLFSPSVQAQQTAAPIAAETLQSMLAIQIRAQGFTCDKALRATRDAKRSRPDRATWVL